MKFHASRRSNRNGGARVRWRHFTTHPMPKLSASELTEILVEKYHFTHMDDDELEELEEFPDLFGWLSENALVFNYEGDYITECEEPEEGDPSVEKIYKFIRRSGWSLDEHPLETMCWILYPTDQLQCPIKTLLDR